MRVAILIVLVVAVLIACGVGVYALLGVAIRKHQ